MRGARSKRAGSNIGLALATLSCGCSLVADADFRTAPPADDVVAPPPTTIAGAAAPPTTARTTVEAGSGDSTCTGGPDCEAPPLPVVPPPSDPASGGPVACGPAVCMDPFGNLQITAPELPRACCYDSSSGRCGTSTEGSDCTPAPQADPSCPTLELDIPVPLDVVACCTAEGQCGLSLGATPCMALESLRTTAPTLPFPQPQPCTPAPSGE